MLKLSLFTCCLLQLVNSELVCPGNSTISPFEVSEFISSSEVIKYPKPRTFEIPIGDTPCYVTQYTDKDIGRKDYYEGNTKKSCDDTKMYNGAISLCVNIPAGFYRDPTDNDIKVCLSGYICREGSVRNGLRNTGDTYACPAGKYCPAGLTTEPIDCPIGTFSKKGQSECIICEDNSVAAKNGTANACSTCPNGQVANSSKTECILCQPGTYQDQNTCMNCTARFYQDQEGMNSCKSCPKGTYCPDERRILPKPCDQGFYCPETEMINGYPCKDLGKVQPSTGASSCETCRDGSVPDPYGYECVACGNGTFAKSGDLECTKCPIGSFNSDQNGVGNCQTCPAGSYCPEVGLSVALTCPPGFKCPSNGLSEPIACTGRDYQNQRGQTSCKTCENGKVSVENNVNCNSCSTGYKQVNNICEPCSAGQYQSESGKDFCQTCQAGYYCPTEKLSNQVQCDPGYYCPGTGLTEQTRCPVNTFTAAKGESKCTSCDNNSISNTNNTACITCISPERKINNVCLAPCGTGSYLPNGGIACVQCEPGTYSNVEDRRNSCTTCEAGYFCSGLGNFEQTLCPPGFYCDVAGLEEPNPCPEDNVQPEAGKKRCNKCGDNSVPNTARTECLDCLEPKFESNGICYNECPKGTRRQVSGNNNYECIDCLPGTYNDIEGSDICKDCEAGFFCPGTAEESMTVCPAGFYCPTSNVINPTECQAGNYCIENSKNPRACQYNEISSENGAAKCDKCPVNQVPNLQHTGCRFCPDGQYVDPNSLYTCNNCEVRYVVNGQNRVHDFGDGCVWCHLMSVVC